MVKNTNQLKISLTLAFINHWDNRTIVADFHNLKSAKLHALCPHVATCLTCLCASVPSCFMCLHAPVPMCLVCLHAHVSTCLACLRAHVPFVLTCLHANVPCVHKCSCVITSNNKNKFSMTCFTYIFGTFSLSFSWEIKLFVGHELR